MAFYCQQWRVFGQLSIFVYHRACKRIRATEVVVLLCVMTLKQIQGPPIKWSYSTLTIKELYDQVDIMYFCKDAGEQNECVAMSLSALIYNKIKGIHG